MNRGVPLLIGICCVWPIIVHFAWIYIGKRIAERDWNHIQWSEIRWPWSKQ
jgi:hypothetical protein